MATYPTYPQTASRPLSGRNTTRRSMSLMDLYNQQAGGGTSTNLPPTMGSPRPPSTISTPPVYRNPPTTPPGAPPIFGQPPTTPPGGGGMPPLPPPTIARQLTPQSGGDILRPLPPDGGEKLLPPAPPPGSGTPPPGVPPIYGAPPAPPTAAPPTISTPVPPGAPRYVGPPVDNYPSGPGFSGGSAGTGAPIEGSAPAGWRPPTDAISAMPTLPPGMRAVPKPPRTDLPAPRPGDLTPNKAKKPATSRTSSASSSRGR